MGSRFLPLLQRQCTGQLFNPRRLLSFQSSVSLKNLYPTSSLRITTPTEKIKYFGVKTALRQSILSRTVLQVPSKPNEKFNGFIPVDTLDISYSRSSGPGGQHVNKVNTKVEVRFKLDTASWIHEELRARVKQQHRNRITREGFFIISSEKTRSQQLNLADCLDRLRNIIRDAELPEKKELSPEEKFIRSKRIEARNRERLKEKRSRSLTKQFRSGGVWQVD